MKDNLNNNALYYINNNIKLGIKCKKCKILIENYIKKNNNKNDKNILNIKRKSQIMLGELKKSFKIIKLSLFIIK